MSLSQALWLSLASAFSGAISALLAKYVLRFAETRRYLTVNFIILFVLLIPLAPFNFALQWTVPALLLMLLASCIDGLGNFYYFRAFEQTDAGTASALLSLGPIFTLALALLFPTLLSAPLNLANLAGVLVTVGGVIVLNQALRNHREAQTPAAPLHRRLFAPLMSSLLFGLNVYLVKHILNAGIANPFTYYFVRLFIVAVMSYFAWRPDLSWVTLPRLGVIAGRAVFVIAKWLIYLHAVDLGNPALVKSASEVSPLFVVGLSALFLNERLTRDKFLGILLIIGGLWLIAV